jgi:PAS domain S-box-containing protein
MNRDHPGYDKLNEWYTTLKAAASASEWGLIINAFKDAVWVLDDDQRFLYFNRAAVNHFKCKTDAMIGKHCWEIVHCTKKPISGCPFLRVRRSLKRETMDMQEGDRWFEVLVDPILDANNGFTGAIHIVSDITYRKQAEEQLRQKNDRLTALLEISTTLAGSHNSQILFQTITDIAAKILPHGASVIYLLKNTTVHVAVATPELSPNLPEKFRTLSLSDHPHICRAMDTDSPVILADIREAKLTAAEKRVSDLLGLCSLIYLPLIHKDKPIGVLMVGNVEKPHRFFDEEVDFLQAMANHISLEIEDARLFEENQRHIAELECMMKEQQQTQKALQESESLFRNLFKKHAAVKLIIDPDNGRIVDANEAAAKFYGWSQEELRQMKISDINMLSSS